MKAVGRSDGKYGGRWGEREAVRGLRCEEEEEAVEFERKVENEFEWLRRVGIALNEVEEERACDVGRPFFSSEEKLRPENATEDDWRG